MSDTFHHHGDLSLLEQEPIGFLCSTRCDGDTVLAAYAWARKQCDLGSTVISGFHTPVEKDVYAILARRGARLIHCPARSLPKRLDPKQKQLIDENRLLILTPFGTEITRATRDTAAIRNRFVIRHAQTVTGYCHPDSTLNTDLGGILIRL